MLLDSSTFFYEKDNLITYQYMISGRTTAKYDQSAVITNARSECVQLVDVPQWADPARPAERRWQPGRQPPGAGRQWNPRRYVSQLTQWVWHIKYIFIRSQPLSTLIELRFPLKNTYMLLVRRPTWLGNVDIFIFHITMLFGLYFAASCVENFSFLLDHFDHSLGT